MVGETMRSWKDAWKQGMGGFGLDEGLVFRPIKKI